MSRRRTMLQRQEEDEVKEWRLINKITLESDSREITVSTDSDGQPFELSEFAINVVAMNDSGSNQAAHVLINGCVRSANAITVPKNAANIPSFYQALAWSCGPVMMSASGSGAYGSRGNVITCCQPEYLNFEKIQKVAVQMASANCKFCAGATLTLYGR